MSFTAYQVSEVASFYSMYVTRSPSSKLLWGAHHTACYQEVYHQYHIAECPPSTPGNRLFTIYSTPKNGMLTIYIYLFIHNYLCVLGESTTPHPSFPPDLCLYVNLDAKGAQKLFKTLAPQLTVLGIPHFR